MFSGKIFKYWYKTIDILPEEKTTEIFLFVDFFGAGAGSMDVVRLIEEAINPLIN